MLPAAEPAFTDILTCLATHHPFMNVPHWPDSYRVIWFLVAAFKTYYNSSRLIKKSLPDRVVIPMFWTLTIVHLIFIDPTKLNVVVMVPYLLVFSLVVPTLLDHSHGALDGGPVVAVIVGNFFVPLRFIWDVLFVLFIVAELYEEACRASDVELGRVFMIISLIPFLVLCHFIGKPGAGMDNNKPSFYIAFFILGVMGSLGSALQSSLKRKVAFLEFVFTIRLSYLLETYTLVK